MSILDDILNLFGVAPYCEIDVEVGRRDSNLRLTYVFDRTVVPQSGNKIEVPIRQQDGTISWVEGKIVATREAYSVGGYVNLTNTRAVRSVSSFVSEIEGGAAGMAQVAALAAITTSSVIAFENLTGKTPEEYMKDVYRKGEEPIADLKLLVAEQKMGRPPTETERVAMLMKETIETIEKKVGPIDLVKKEDIEGLDPNEIEGIDFDNIE